MELLKSFLGIWPFSVKHNTGRAFRPDNLEIYTVLSGAPAGSSGTLGIFRGFIYSKSETNSAGKWSMTLPAHQKVQHWTKLSDEHDKKLCHIQMLCPNQQMLRAGKPMIFGSFENLKDILLGIKKPFFTETNRCPHTGIDIFVISDYNPLWSHYSISRMARFIIYIIII